MNNCAMNNYSHIVIPEIPSQKPPPPLGIFLPPLPPQSRYALCGSRDLEHVFFLLVLGHF